VTESVGRPAYQQVADDLRRKIAAGELPVGAAIPSTAQLTKAYGVSSTVVRAAVAQLRADGLLVGQPGKGVFVRATPDSAAKRAASIGELSQQVKELQAELGRIKSAQREELAAELGAVRQEMSRVRRELMDLYDHLGRPRPGDGPVGDKPGE
jgi:GntR family transcriptional regulator